MPQRRGKNLRIGENSFEKNFFEFFERSPGSVQGSLICERSSRQLVEEKLSYSPAQQLNFLGKAVHPLPRLAGQVDGRTDAVPDADPFVPLDQVIGMGNDLLFRGCGYAVAGLESEKGALVRSQPGTGVALDNPGECLGIPHLPEKVGPPLGMVDGMGTAAAKVMEHGSLFNKRKIGCGIVPRIFEGTIGHCPAMGYHFCAAPRVLEQLLVSFPCAIRHGPANS
jgi:hypothetical protein